MSSLQREDMMRVAMEAVRSFLVQRSPSLRAQPAPQLPIGVSPLSTPATPTARYHATVGASVPSTDSSATAAERRVLTEQQLERADATHSGADDGSYGCGGAHRTATLPRDCGYAQRQR